TLIQVAPVADATIQPISGAAKLFHVVVDVILAVRTVNAAVVEVAIHVVLQPVRAVLDTAHGIAQRAAVVTIAATIVGAVVAILIVITVATITTIIAVALILVALVAPPPRIVVLRGGEAGQTESEDDGGDDG